MHTQVRSMFNHLTDLNYTRSGKEAIGFYLAYLLLIVIVSAIAGAIFGSTGMMHSQNGFYTGMKIGTLVAIISCITLSYLIIGGKKSSSKFSSILLALIAGILAMIGGGLLGLIIPSYLSTLGTTKATPKKKKKK